MAVLSEPVSETVSEPLSEPTEAVPPLPSSLSPSKVSSFTTCALAFRFAAIDRLPEPPSEAAVRGTLVHLALQRLFRHDAPGRTVHRALAELDAAIEEMAADPEMEALDLDPTGQAAMREAAIELVHRYFAMEDPTAVRAIGLELLMEAEVDGLVLRGIIDRLDLTDEGELVVTDYKTGSAPPERYEKGRLKGVEFYALLCERVLGRLPARVQLLYLGDGQTIVATASPRTVRSVERRTAAVWTAIERAYASDGFKPRRGPLCSWCSFQTYCPEFGGDPAAGRAEGLRLAATSPAA